MNVFERYKLCTNPETKKRPIVPAEIVARLMGFTYTTKDDKRNFKTRFIEKGGIKCLDAGLDETRTLVDGKISKSSNPSVWVRSLRSKTAQSARTRLEFDFFKGTISKEPTCIYFSRK